MAIDVKALLARRAQAQAQVPPTVHTVNEPSQASEPSQMCAQCGHPKGSHADDGTCHICVSEGIECIPTKVQTKNGQESGAIASFPPTPISTTPMCVCGHEEADHDDSGPCTMPNCDCPNYIASNPLEVKAEPITSQTLNEIVKEEIREAEVQFAMVDAIKEAKEVSGENYAKVKEAKDKPAKSPFFIPPGVVDARVDQSQVTVTEDLSQIPDTNCHHLCPKCQKWFSHGAKNKCRHFDLQDYGKCKDCLAGAPEEQPTDGIYIDNGKYKLKVEAEAKIRADQRNKCKDMNVDQLEYHIDLLARRIIELQARQLESRKMKVVLEEEELQLIPEHEREAWIQQQRQKKKETRSARPKKVEEDEKGLSKLEKAIRAFMRSSGKSRKEAEAMLGIE